MGINQSHSRLPVWIFCLPALITLGILVIYPLSRTIVDSFSDATLSTLDHSNWIGFGNYLQLIQDPNWWRSVLNTLLFTVCSVTLEAFFGLGIAVLLNAELRARGWIRAAILVPWAIPAVVSARIWAWMFHDLYGVINRTLLTLHLTKGQTAWLADPHLTLFTLVLVDVWKTTPFMALMILAGLQSIPSSLYDASKIDGASPWREFIFITLPLLRPALGIAILFRMMDALRVFDLPFVLTSNSRTTSVISIFARQQMVDFQSVGYGSAASILIFCTIGSLAFVYLLNSRQSLGLESE